MDGTSSHKEYRWANGARHVGEWRDEAPGFSRESSFESPARHEFMKGSYLMRLAPPSALSGSALGVWYVWLAQQETPCHTVMVGLS